MILRRVIAHFRKQEWTAIAIDFVIVVVGILIAFQITAIGERRAERAREARYLAGVALDLRADLEELELIRANAERRMSAAGAILEKAGAPAPRRNAGRNFSFEAAPAFVSDDPFAANAALSGVPTYDGTRFTFDALISTGDLRVLRDPALTRAIQSYYAGCEELRDFGETLEEVRAAVAASRHRLGVANFAAITLDEIAALTAEDRVFAAELETYWHFSGYDMRLSASLHARAIALIAEIEASR